MVTGAVNITRKMSSTRSHQHHFDLILIRNIVTVILVTYLRCLCLMTSYVTNTSTTGTLVLSNSVLDLLPGKFSIFSTNEIILCINDETRLPVFLYRQTENPKKIFENLDFEPLNRKIKFRKTFFWSSE